MAYDIFILSGVLDELHIPESELTGFLSAVSAHYHSPEDVPYHNLSHVVQVLHAVWLVSSSGLALTKWGFEGQCLLACSCSVIAL